MGSDWPSVLDGIKTTFFHYEVEIEKGNQQANILAENSYFSYYRFHWENDRKGSNWLVKYGKEGHNNDGN